MAKEWVIEKKEGKSWLTPYGWAPAKHYALRFRLKSEADQHINANPHLIAEGNAVQEDFSENPQQNYGAQTDYSIFGPTS